MYQARKKIVAGRTKRRRAAIELLELRRLLDRLPIDARIAVPHALPLLVGLCRFAPTRRRPSERARSLRPPEPLARDAGPGYSGILRRPRRPRASRSCRSPSAPS